MNHDLKHLLKSILLIFTLILSSSAFTTGANATPGDLEDWHLVGGQGVSEGAVGDVSLAIHDDIPYVAIQDTFPEFGISVMRYIDGGGSISVNGSLVREGLLRFQ